MKYINTKTHAIIETDIKINGGNWVLYEEKKSQTKKKSTKKEDEQ